MVVEILNKKKVDICWLQETEIPTNFPEEILNCGNYIAELELSDGKKRVGMYINKDIKYKRRFDLEENNHHIVTFGDVIGPKRITEKSSLSVK